MRRPPRSTLFPGATLYPCKTLVGTKGRFPGGGVATTTALWPLREAPSDVSETGGVLKPIGFVSGGCYTYDEFLSLYRIAAIPYSEVRPLLGQRVVSLEEVSRRPPPFGH